MKSLQIVLELGNVYLLVISAAMASTLGGFWHVWFRAFHVFVITLNTTLCSYSAGRQPPRHLRSQQHHSKTVGLYIHAKSNSLRSGVFQYFECWKRGTVRYFLHHQHRLCLWRISEVSLRSKWKNWESDIKSITVAWFFFWQLYLSRSATFYFPYFPATIPNANTINFSEISRQTAEWTMSGPIRSGTVFRVKVTAYNKNDNEQGLDTIGVFDLTYTVPRRNSGAHVMVHNSSRNVEPWWSTLRISLTPQFEGTDYCDILESKSYGVCRRKLFGRTVIRYYYPNYYYSNSLLFKLLLIGKFERKPLSCGFDFELATQTFCGWGLNRNIVVRLRAYGGMSSPSGSPAFLMATPPATASDETFLISAPISVSAPTLITFKYAIIAPTQSDNIASMTAFSLAAFYEGNPIPFHLWTINFWEWYLQPDDLVGRWLTGHAILCIHGTFQLKLISTQNYLHGPHQVNLALDDLQFHNETDQVIYDSQRNSTCDPYPVSNTSISCSMHTYSPRFCGWTWPNLINSTIQVKVVLTQGVTNDSTEANDANQNSILYFIAYLSTSTAFLHVTPSEDRNEPGESLISVELMSTRIDSREGLGELSFRYRLHHCDVEVIMMEHDSGRNTTLKTLKFGHNLPGWENFYANWIPAFFVLPRTTDFTVSVRRLCSSPSPLPLPLPLFPD